MSLGYSGFCQYQCKWLTGETCLFYVLLRVDMNVFLFHPVVDVVYCTKSQLACNDVWFFASLCDCLFTPDSGCEVILHTVSDLHNARSLRVQCYTYAMFRNKKSFLRAIFSANVLSFHTAGFKWLTTPKLCNSTTLGNTTVQYHGSTLQVLSCILVKTAKSWNTDT